jgi:hypothetical protein
MQLRGGVAPNDGPDHVHQPRQLPVKHLILVGSLSGWLVRWFDDPFSWCSVQYVGSVVMVMVMMRKSKRVLGGGTR